MASITQESEKGGRYPLAGSVACEACRKLKMRCVRPPQNAIVGGNPGSGLGNGNACQRCQRTGRSCITTKPGQPGRKPGKVGAFRGINKALRTLQSEIQKAHGSEDGKPLLPEAEVSRILQLVEATISPQSGKTCSKESRPSENRSQATFLITDSGADQHAVGLSKTTSNLPPVSAQDRESCSEQPNNSPVARETPMSNPLALLVEASEHAQTHQHIANRHESRASNNIDVARTILRRPGYVSLGLNLSRETLEEGLECLLDRASRPVNVPFYFAAPRNGSQSRDVSPYLDPINLGLVSTEEAHHLFIIYFTRLHPFNGILDPILHTPNFVQSRSGLLFTWILALAAQFDADSAMLSKRLLVHGQRLSRHVYSQGWKSIEIVQAYYISLISNRPIDPSFQETFWMYKAFAIGMATELGLNQPCDDQNQVHKEPRDETQDRITRNEKRTWLRMLTWDRAQEASRGRMKPIPPCDMSFVELDSWWMHPLADTEDRNACANIHLRNILALLHEEIRRKMLSGEHGSDLHWVKHHVDSALNTWQTSWLHEAAEASVLSDVFLRFVFMCSRLWALSFALAWTKDASLEEPVSRTTMTDCFEAAIACCEESISLLDRIGEPLYCMNAPVWIMISYAAVLSLKLFRFLHGTREGYDVEVLALVAQVASHLERAGTTPSHRCVVSAVCGQQLFLTLRSYASSLGTLISGMGKPTRGREDTSSTAGCQNLHWKGPTWESGSPSMEPEDMHWSMDPTITMFDPSLFGSLLPGGETFNIDDPFVQLPWK